MPKVVDHAERRAEISAAAWKVIARDGFDKLTMRSIAAEVGVSHSALARYFPNKASLLDTAFTQTQKMAEERIETQTKGKRGLEALDAFAYAVLPVADTGPKHARVALAFWNHAIQGNDFELPEQEHARGWRERILQFLREAEEDGELAAGVDLLGASDQIAALNMGWTLIRLLMPEFSGDERMLRAAHDLIYSFSKNPETPQNNTKRSKRE